MTAFLSVAGLAKSYPGAGDRLGPPVFEDVSFAMERGEFVCIVGHSGCGKTTILNVLAGLERASDGLVLHGRARGGRAGRSSGASCSRATR